MNSYDEMIKRLQAYRKSIGLKQRQICQSLNVTQEQYSYLENGIIKLNDIHLKALHKTGLNLDYLITGKEYDYTAKDLDGVLDGLDEAQRDFASKMLASLFIEKWERGSIPDASSETAMNIKFLKAAADSWNSISMVGFVRDDIGISQNEMMKKLGVSIKKYRQIEREKKYPDAEMLLNLYDISGYPPSMFMNIYDRRLLALKAVWLKFKYKEKQPLISFIRKTAKLV